MLFSNTRAKLYLLQFIMSCQTTSNPSYIFSMLCLSSVEIKDQHCQSLIFDLTVGTAIDIELVSSTYKIKMQNCPLPV